MTQDIHEHFQFLYGPEIQDVYRRLMTIIASYREKIDCPLEEVESYFDEQDVVLITYGDMVQTPGENPLFTLVEFLEASLQGAINTIHLLPFYPYSSDDGFSVIDYKKVDPKLGDWVDVARFRQTFRLMFDAVVNHISVESDWFAGFVENQPPYNEYFTVIQPGMDLSQVFRPRSLPLLTEVQTADGVKLVWTTFSADQIDLNYQNPEVLLSVLEILLFYIAQGATYIRLDAIAYIWKELGSPCIHLAPTHRIIQLMRSVLNEVAPAAVLITETNVPHVDNISYFGDGYNEAQMVYNFSLPPLTLHAFHTGSATVLSRWAESLTLPSNHVTFFNFLASHDGIGVTPARGYLSDAEVNNMALRVEKLGGFVSYRSGVDGTNVPYELNINYLDALGDPEAEHEKTGLIARRFLASQAIMLALRGVPGIYFHSLFGSRGWPEGVEKSGRSRTINRQKLQKISLQQELGNHHSLRAHILYPYLHLLRQRAAEPAFHPNSEQEILVIHEAIFALRRSTVDGRRQVLCLQNVSATAITLSFHQAIIGSKPDVFIDLIDGKRYQVVNEEMRLQITGYGVMWLRADRH